MLFSPVDLVEYQKLCWAFAFGVLQEALPIDAQLREQFLQLVANSFVDPRLPAWLKQLLTNGAESLVLHSCRHFPHTFYTSNSSFPAMLLASDRLPWNALAHTSCNPRNCHLPCPCTPLALTENFKRVANMDICSTKISRKISINC